MGLKLKIYIKKILKGYAVTGLQRKFVKMP